MELAGLAPDRKLCRMPLYYVACALGPQAGACDMGWVLTEFLRRMRLSLCCLFTRSDAREPVERFRSERMEHAVRTLARCVRWLGCRIATRHIYMRVDFLQ
jgi:hypothetical protein